jgi:hypothetical protein
MPMKTRRRIIDFSEFRFFIVQMRAIMSKDFLDSMKEEPTYEHFLL